MKSNQEEPGNLLFPIFVKFNSLRVLLVGGGAVALEKLDALIKGNPDLKLRIIAKELIASEIKDRLKIMPNTKLSIRKYEKQDLKNTDLVIVAANNDKLNHKIRKQCRKRNILVNVADTPDLCDFYLGSIIKKGDLKIAISTNGKSPTLAKRMRQYLEEAIPDDIQFLMDNLRELRNQLKGDFEYKVDELNKVTESWLKTKSVKKKDSKKIE